VPLVSDPQVKALYIEACEKRDAKSLAPRAGTLLALLDEATVAEAQKLIDEGFTTEEGIFDKEGERVGSVIRKNPRAEVVMTAMGVLGATAKQQGITPEAKTADRSVDALAALSAQIKNAQALGGGLPVADLGDEDD